MSTTGSSSGSDRSAPHYGNWALFLRQRRLMAQLGRLQNDFKHCYCPPGCNGSLHTEDGVPAGPGPQPPKPVHAPSVRVDGDLPRTWARPLVHRNNGTVVVAETRGISDILLHRDRARATLRMSLQVRKEQNGDPRVCYFGEMFLTRWGHEEEFCGFIQSWHVDRRSNEDWEDQYLTNWRDDDSDDSIQITETQVFLQKLFNITFTHDKDAYQYDYPAYAADAARTENAMLLPAQRYREHFGAAWARISDDTTDILHMPLIWIRKKFQGQRIVSQGFELLFRLMTGGTLPEEYNITRPMSVLLEAGELGAPYDGDWRDSNGEYVGWRPQLNGIARGYARGGFMRLIDVEARPDDDLDYLMGRSVDPAEYHAAPGDMRIVPPNPPASDENSPSPTRRRRGRGSEEHPSRGTSPVSPLLGRGRSVGSDGGSGDDDGGSDDDQHP